MQQVTSQIRCLPSDNGVGRLFPFRINDMNGKRLLYSSSNDRNCSNLNPNPFVGMINLWTEVNN